MSVNSRSEVNMFDRQQCGLCECWFAPKSRPKNAMEPGMGIPPGYRPVFHLCGECAGRTRARRSELWGWLVPISAVPRVDH